MATTIVGEIVLLAKIDTSQYKKGASEIDGVNSKMESGGEKTTRRLNDGFSRVAKVGMAAAAVAAVAVGAALTKAATASWNQVDAVQQATVGLRAYEKDGTKVNKVLGQLVKYARSDMGVLFNRKDLFQSAQMLKLNGVSTGDLSKNVKILSRSVGIGLGNWKDLNSVVGRVVSTGRLTGIEFDLLTQYGFRLSKSLRNTNLSAEELFAALDKGIPVDAMEGQANTIKGLGIRMESAFRGIGDAVLGVDANTSKFIKDGLGDKLTQGLAFATQALKNIQPTIAELANKFVAVAIKIGTYLSPKIQELWGKTKELATKLFELAIQIGKYLSPKIAELWGKIKELLPSLFEFLNTYIKPLAGAIGTGLVIAIGLAIDGLTLLVDFLKPTFEWLNRNENAVKEVVGVLGAYLLAMKIIAAYTAFAGFMTAATNAMILFRAKIIGANTQMGLFKIIMGTPFVLAVVVAAALIALAQVYRAVIAIQDAFKAVENLKTAQQNSSDATANANKGMQDLLKNGTSAQKKRAQNYFLKKNRGFAKGTNFAPGGVALVGERGPEIVNLPRGSQVIPNNKLGGLGGSNVTINIGTIYKEVDADRLINRVKQVLAQDQVLESRGIAT